ncbi:MAG: hypothetical protein NTW61_01995 [Candidatus Melainabacteria bacterium]|nr:hypothetical protein [Candidatus Melainabacteria bacterium]
MTVPNVVASVQKTKTKAMGKSLIQATADFFRTAYLNGEIQTTTAKEWVYLDNASGKNNSIVQLAMQRMNPVRVCDINSTTVECGSSDPDIEFRTAPRFIFADGSVLAFWCMNSDRIGISVDYNGFKEGPNFTWAQRQEAGNASLSDRNYLMVNISDSTISGGGFDCKPGMLCPAHWYPTTIPIWNALFNS